MASLLKIQRVTIIIHIFYSLQTQHNLTLAAFQFPPNLFPLSQTVSCNQMGLMLSFLHISSPLFHFFFLWWILNVDKKKIKKSAGDVKMEMDNMITDDESRYPSPPTLFASPSSFCLSPASSSPLVF